MRPQAQRPAPGPAPPTHLAEVELEARAVLAHLGLHALLARQQLHGEDPELVLDAGHLHRGRRGGAELVPLAQCPAPQPFRPVHASCLRMVMRPAVR